MFDDTTLVNTVIFIILFLVVALELYILYKLNSKSNLRQTDERFKNLLDLNASIQDEFLNQEIKLGNFEKRLTDLENLWLEKQEPESGPLSFPYTGEALEVKPGSNGHDKEEDQKIVAVVPNQDSLKQSIRIQTNAEKILDVLKQGEKTTREISDETKIPVNNLYTYIFKLKKKNKIKQKGNKVFLAEVVTNG